MNRPIYTYEVDLKLTGKVASDSQIVTSRQDAYSVGDAIQQACYTTLDATKFSDMKVIRVGPPLDMMLAQEIEMLREVERQSRHTWTAADAVAKLPGGNPVNLGDQR